MSDTDVANKEFVLPPSIVSKVDVSRLVSEVERYDNELTAVAVRDKVNGDTNNTPALSTQMTDFLAANQLELGDSHGRSELVTRLRCLKNDVPVIHLTFAASVDHESLQELAKWLRDSVHPQVVVAVGMQPSLVGGVYIRTINHVHDLSIRAQLAGHRDLLVKELEAIGGGR